MLFYMLEYACYISGELIFSCFTLQYYCGRNCGIVGEGTEIAREIAYRTCLMFLPETASFVSSLFFAVHPIHTEAVREMSYLNCYRK